jgi:hypothetical protein
MNMALVHQIGRRLGLPGVAAVLCGAVAIAVFLTASTTIFSALAVPSANLVEQAEKERKQNEDKYLASFNGYVAQVNGRSLFITPGRPPAKEAPRTAANDKPATLPPPAVYGGPSLIAMVNGVAWFNDGKKLAVGEGDSELKIVELQPPWAAVVKWKDVQFTISLFDRETEGNPLAPKTEKPKPAESTEALMGPEAPPDAFDKPGDAKPGAPKPPEAAPPPIPRPPEQARGDEPSAPPAGDQPAPMNGEPSEPARDTPPESN